MFSVWIIQKKISLIPRSSTAQLIFSGAVKNFFVNERNVNHNSTLKIEFEGKYLLSSRSIFNDELRD
jgi:hypothetical protein